MGSVYCYNVVTMPKHIYTQVNSIHLVMFAADVIRTHAKN